jgi:hypothetical protein
MINSIPRTETFYRHRASPILPESGAAGYSLSDNPNTLDLLSLQAWLGAVVLAAEEISRP